MLSASAANARAPQRFCYTVLCAVNFYYLDRNNDTHVKNFSLLYRGPGAKSSRSTSRRFTTS